jgi:hypothetical protein
MLSSRNTISLEYLIRGLFVFEEGMLNITVEKLDAAKLTAPDVNSWLTWSKD